MLPSLARTPSSLNHVSFIAAPLPVDSLIAFGICFDGIVTAGVGVGVDFVIVVLLLVGMTVDVADWNSVGGNVFTLNVVPFTGSIIGDDSRVADDDVRVVGVCGDDFVMNIDDAADGDDGVDIVFADVVGVGIDIVDDDGVIGVGVVRFVNDSDGV